MTWLSANLINIVLLAVIVLIIGLLIRSMIRDRKAGKSPCGGSCASCGACSGCSACSKCGLGGPDERKHPGNCPDGTRKASAGQ